MGAQDVGRGRGQPAPSSVGTSGTHLSRRKVHIAPIVESCQFASMRAPSLATSMRGTSLEPPARVVMVASTNDDGDFGAPGTNPGRGGFGSSRQLQPASAPDGTSQARSARQPPSLTVVKAAGGAAPS